MARSNIIPLMTVQVIHGSFMADTYRFQLLQQLLGIMVMRDTEEIHLI